MAKQKKADQHAQIEKQPSVKERIVMFTGLVQALSPVTKARWHGKNIRIYVKRPKGFLPLKTGGSVALNGLCLTAEKVLSDQVVFCLAYETLRQVAQKKPQAWQGLKVHLELPLKLGDPVEGHLLTGHVQGLAQITKIKKKSFCLIWELCFPAPWHTYLREKSFIALNGVSLTLNQVNGNTACVCLVPETLKRTHFKDLKKDAYLNFEVDYLSLLVNPLAPGAKRNE